MTACNSPRTSRVAPRGGFTLPEALMASVVLAVAVIGVSQLTSAACQQSEALSQDTRAIALARELMEEIAGKPFADPNAVSGEEFRKGPDTGETAVRSTWDNVDDYGGLSDTFQTMKTAAGQQVFDATKYPPQETFTRSVAVEYRSAPGGSALPDNAGGDFALVTVTVTMGKGNRQVQLSRLFAKTTIVN